MESFFNSLKFLFDDKYGFDQLQNIDGSLFECHLSEHHDEQVAVLLTIECNQKHWTIEVEKVELEESGNQNIVIITVVAMIVLLCLETSKHFVKTTKNNDNNRVNESLDVTFNLLLIFALSLMLLQLLLQVLVNSHAYEHDQNEQIRSHNSDCASHSVWLSAYLLN